MQKITVSCWRRLLMIQITAKKLYAKVSIHARQWFFTKHSIAKKEFKDIKWPLSSIDINPRENLRHIIKKIFCYENIKQFSS